MLMFPEKDEDFLTSKRVMFIKNKLLTIIAVHNDLHYFLKLNKRNANEWRAPLSNDTTPTALQTNKFAPKNLADSLEAVIGACFANDYDFYPVVELLRRFGLLPTPELSAKPEYISSLNTFLIPNAFFTKVDALLNENMNYLQLKYCTMHFDEPQPKNSNSNSAMEEEELESIPEHERCGGYITPLSQLQSS